MKHLLMPTIGKKDAVKVSRKEAQKAQN